MKRALILAAISVPALAHAHPGLHTAGFTDGAIHPWAGLDHLAAMVAVGLWAVQRGSRALWALPLAFLGAMFGGFLLGANGVSLPAVEPVILASGILLGLAVCGAVRAPLWASLATCALFGVFHGHAHGTEAGGTASLASYAAGFLAATALLHAIGVRCGIGLSNVGRHAWIRGLGAGAAACAAISAWI